jgi:hypothetical protein
MAFETWCFLDMDAQLVCKGGWPVVDLERADDYIYLCMQMQMHTVHMTRSARHPRPCPPHVHGKPPFCLDLDNSSRKGLVGWLAVDLLTKSLDSASLAAGTIPLLHDARALSVGVRLCRTGIPFMAIFDVPDPHQR